MESDAAKIRRLTAEVAALQSELATLKAQIVELTALFPVEVATAYLCGKRSVEC